MQLAQINVGQHPSDDLFFEKLKTEYYQLRPALKRWFSIWIYDHCTFIKVRDVERQPVASLCPPILTNFT